MKKQSFITILLSVLMSMVGAKSFAHDIEVANTDGKTIYYVWTNNNTELSVSYRGTREDSYSNEYSGSIVIPETVEYGGNTYSVTSIGRSAFWECEGLSSVTIPNNVTSIDLEAFEYCRGLTSITIPNNVSSIGNSAFNGCSGLESIKVENSNPKYDSRNNCNAIIDNNNQLIVGCKNTIIPNSVTSIGYGAFEGSGLASITIPHNVKSISLGAFRSCKGLSSVVIGNGVTSINEDAFTGCPSLASIVVENGNEKYDSRDNCNAIIETSSNTLITGCKNTTFPNSITTIGKLAFTGSGLTSIDIPSNVTNIDDYAFMYCRDLISVTIPNSVTSIGQLAFSHCSGLTSVSIPNSITRIGTGAFWACTALAYITIPNSVISIGDYALSHTAWYNNQPDGLVYAGKVVYKFKGEMSDNTHITIKDGTLGIAERAFYDCKNLTSLSFPNSMLCIGDFSFYGCNGLTAIVSEIENPFEISGVNMFDSNIYTTATLIVPAGKKTAYQATNGWKQFTNIIEVGGVGYVFEVDGINYKICENNTVLVISGPTKYSGDINIPSQVTFNEKTYSVTELGVAFRNCSDLSSISILNSVKTIGSQAFEGCSSLTSITIPNSINRIEEDAFKGCVALNAVHISDLEAWLNINIAEATRGIPSSSGPLYYANRLFLNGIEIRNLEIPNTITSIKSFTFENWSRLNSVTIPNSVTCIGFMSFRGCSGLTSVTIPNSVTSIVDYAFWNCSGLKSVTIPNSVTSIGRGTFNSCSSLTSAIIGSGVTSISNVFSGCNNLHEMVLSQTAYENGIPETVTKFTTYSKNPMRVEVETKGATAAVLNISPIEGNGTATVTMQGLKPEQMIPWKLNDKNYGIISEKTEATLTMEVQPAQPTSKTKARLMATVNELDDDIHFGFEWLRYDAPDNMTPNKVSSPLYEGQIVGSLSNLNPDVYYKYRPYYKADDGTMFYGEWESFITGDADVFYEPETHTKDASGITSVSAQLEGVWVEGTDDTLEKGFEYWTVSEANTRTVGNDVQTVIVSGSETTATIEGLVPNTEYGFRSYVKTASGTAYGEEKTFKTNIEGGVVDGIIFALKDDGTLEVVGLEAGVTTVDILSTVTIDGTEYQVTSIGVRAFEGRDDIEYLSIPWSVKSIGEYAFVDCGSSITVNIADPESWCEMELGNEHSSPLSSAGKVLVHDVETDQIDIPSSVSSINNFTFYQCRCIKTLTIPATVTSIGSSAYEDCTGLTTLTLSEGLETIGGSAFEGCTGLKSLTLPSTVNTISINAFKNCMGITDVYCYAEDVPETHEDAFDVTPTGSSILHVPASAIKAYRETWPWSDFKAVIAIGASGDVDGNGEIDKADLDAIVEHIMGRTPEGFNVEEADLNGDSKVNVADVTIMVNMIK